MALVTLRRNHGWGTSEKESGRRNHRGGIMEKNHGWGINEESWRRNHWGGIMGSESLKSNDGWGINEEESWRRNHEGGTITEKESGIWKVSGRHLRAIWEASERYLGGIWEVSGRHLGAGEAQGGQPRISPKKVSKSIMLFCKSWNQGMQFTGVWKIDLQKHIVKLKSTLPNRCKNNAFEK